MSIIIENDLDGRIAARVLAERTSRGWSLEQLAERSGVSRAMISKIEREGSSPTAAVLGRCAAAFGLTLSQLLARAEQGATRLLNREAEQERWRDPDTGFERRGLTPPGSTAPRRGGQGALPRPGPGLRAPAANAPWLHRALELVWGELPPKARVDYPASAFT